MNTDERDAIAYQFGVAPEQVERDHLIPHLLAVLSDRFADRIQFIGGTALVRTHLPEGRLSEDIDLIAASKTVTWADRSAPRDLWDLWALNGIGAINKATLGLFRKFGPTSRPPGGYFFSKPPSDAEWRTQLAGQTRLTVTAAEALTIVRAAWARAVAQEHDNPA